MPLNLASPGILVREVDLTLGRIDPTSDKIGGIVGPFAQGPVGTPTLIQTENDLLDTFGQPYDTDKHYETWLTASSYLAYGGILNVIRADDFNSTTGVGLKNAFVGTATSVRIKSVENYEELGYDTNILANVTVAARNPGTWANGIKIGIVDGRTDQTLSGVDVASPEGKTAIAIGYGVTQAVPTGTVVSKTGTGAGTTEALDGYWKGIITNIDSANSKIDVKFLSHVSTAGTETTQDYNSIYKFSNSGTVAIHTNGQAASYASTSYTSQVDWFDQQELQVSAASTGGTTTYTTIKWNTLADRPTTSEYASARGSRFDELHVVVIDAKGSITGNAGTILEKHLNLSKAKDATFSVGSNSYWRKYLETTSEHIFGLSSPSGITTTGYSSSFTEFADGGWDQNAEGIIFDSIGTLNGTLGGGTNYGGQTSITATGALDSGLDDLVSGYGLFENDTNVDVDFLLMGSAKGGEDATRALATKLIAVAEKRKDAVAFISPYRASMITDNPNQDTVDIILSDSNITDNVINFFEPITSSSYAVFDSGYKYMFDRFANTFRYIPLNGDIAGLCARTDINQFPWFSPAGTARGAILNAIKLAYNPGKDERDRLYSSRINPVIFSPGSGIILYGDKTGFAKASAFDRINVRRLFIFLEDAISAAAKDQLFEFNDEITRTNFVNIVEPFLRDVQAKRGIQDYVVICDETNNTAAIIDANEFIADIYIKPARAINFIGLNFIATRTGVSFEEVIGNV